MGLVSPLRTVKPHGAVLTVQPSIELWALTVQQRAEQKELGWGEGAQCKAEYAMWCHPPAD